MKRTIQFFLLPSLLITLLFIYGCPVGIDYPPDKPGTVLIDKALLGTWTCVMDTCSDLQVVKVEKIDEYSYAIEVLQEGEMYALEDVFFTGYLTKIDGIDILYALEESTGKFYNYHYKISGNNLILYDVSLLVGGMDAVTSTEAFRAEISASAKLEGFLKEPTQFSRN